LGQTKSWQSEIAPGRRGPGRGECGAEGGASEVVAKKRGDRFNEEFTLGEITRLGRGRFSSNETSTAKNVLEEFHIQDRKRFPGRGIRYMRKLPLSGRPSPEAGVASGTLRSKRASSGKQQAELIKGTSGKEARAAPIRELSSARKKGRRRWLE